MFWIEESPTNAQDDDSDVPFDECPGQPMACEQEIELVIRPDDDFYKEQEDADTWPETLSATNNTQDGSTDEDQSTVRDHHNDAQILETIDDDDDVVDDDATQVMGEHHTIDDPEDEQTESIQDRSFVYLAKVKSELSQANAAIAAAAAAAETEGSMNDQEEEEASSPLNEQEDEPVDATLESSLPQQQQAGTTFASAPIVVEDDEESSPPSLVNEPEESVSQLVDDAEHDLASTSSCETKSLHEMNDLLDEQDPNWYDQWQPLEETNDGISCISNMFAPIETASRAMPIESMEIYSNPTMTTVFSDGAEVSQIANVDQLILPPLDAQEALTQEEAVAPQEATSTSSTNSSSAASREASKPEDEQEEEPSTPMHGPKIVLILEGEDDNGESTTNMTLTEFLNANCQQGSRKERRMRIMERQRNALARIQPMPASVAPTHATGGGPGFFDQLFEFDPMEQLQNIGAELFG